MFYFRSTIQPQSSFNNIQFINFPNSVMCYFTQITTIVCDSPQRQRLVVDYPIQFQNNWLHFTMSICKLGNAFLQIKSGSEIIAYNSVESQFTLHQHEDSYLCIGMCLQTIQTFDIGFTGDIREVYLRNYFYNNMTTFESFDYNVIQSYKSDVLAYYRLKDLNDQFNSNQVVLKTTLSQDNNTKSVKSQFNFQIAPVDICPVTSNVRSFVQFENKKGQQIKPKDLGIKPKPRDYEYTMSLTLLIERDQCFTRNLTQAVINCSLVNFERVFTLYLSAPNLARFHFYAEKNYFESQTAQFFIPYNQWVTIQMQMSQYTGYQVVVLDFLGEVLVQHKLNYNMQTQKPNSKLYLFNGLRGLVSRFILSDSAVPIPTPHYLFKKTLLNLNFQNMTTIKQSLFMQNAGSSGMIQFTYVPNLKSVNYINFEYRQPRTSPLRKQFDGVTCRNKHQNVLLRNSKYDLSVQIQTNKTSKLNPTEQTIEFWFKLGNSSAYRPQNVSIDFTMQIFEMKSVQSYWQIYLQDSYLINRSNTTMSRSLVIAPFGNSTDQILRFTEFKLQNEDKWGWWHISCSYKQQDNLECILYNTKIRIRRQISIANVQIQIPQGQFTCIFRKQIDQLFVKNFRVWSNKQSVDTIRLTRYQNVTGQNNLIIETSFLNETELLQTDFIVEQLPSVYDSKTQQIKNVNKTSYHLICPPYTYYKNENCYSNPLNKIVLSVFPIWSINLNELIWNFSLEHSQAMFNNSQLQGINITFSSSDLHLKKLLMNGTKGWSCQIQSRRLRDELQYNVQSVITNNRFYNYTEIQFVPQKCSWLEVVGSDAFSGRQVINTLPGGNNITFIIQVVRNPSVNCSGQINFYDQLDLNFEYDVLIQSMDDIRFTDKPKLEFQYFVEQDVKKIKVTIAKQEQLKLPLFTDIKILINMQWQSSMLDIQDQSNQNQNLIFQHLLYTIKLAPLEVQLVPVLNANTQKVSYGQTLVLSAANTTVNNTDLQVIKDQLTYQWYCPEDFNIICYQQIQSDTLIIPYNQLVQSSNISFQIQYNFTVEIQWLRPDGIIIASNATIGAVWYDSQSMPKFKIDCQIVAISQNKTQTSCQILGRDFDGRQALNSYFVDWVITTPQDQQLATVLHYILNGNEQFIIDQSLLKNSTTYLILATVTLRDYISIKTLMYYQFTYIEPIYKQTNLPPLFGTNQQITENKTDNSTLDNQLQNTTQSDSNITSNDTTKSNATQSENNVTSNNSTLLNGTQSDNSVTSNQTQSGNNLTSNDTTANLTQTDNILPSNESTIANATQSDNNVTNSDTIIANETQSNNSGTSNDSTILNTADNITGNNSTVENITDSGSNPANIEPSIINQPQTENSATNDDPTDQNATQSNSNIISNESEIANATQLDNNLTESVNQQTNEIQPQDSELLAPQTNQEQEINNQTTNDDIVLQQNQTGNRRLQDTELFQIYQELQDFIPKDNTTFVQDFTIKLQQAFTEIPNVAILFNSYDVLAYLVDVYELQPDNLLPLLQTLRQYGSDVQDQQIISNILERLLDLPVGSYKTEDFSVASAVFNYNTAILNIPIVMQALNSNFTLSPQDLYFQFASESMHDYYMQSIAILDALNQTQVYLRVVDSVSLEQYSIGQLSGRAELTFQMPSPKPIITECATNQNSDWSTEFCLTEYIVDSSIIKCTCNMMQATLISVITSITQEVQKISKVQSEQITIDDNHSTDIKGISYSFIAIVSWICLQGIIISIIVWRLDRKDQLKLKQPFNSLQTDFLKKISEEQNQPYDLVKLRGHELIQYQVQGQNALVWITLAIHPYFAPFSTFNPIQSRLLRYNTYQFQVNIYILSAMIYFYNDIYRKADLNRKNYLLDAVDLGNMSKIIILGQLLLIPTISIIFDHVLSNRLILNKNNAQIIVTNRIFRGLFITLCQILNIANVVAAVDISINSPATNQICSEFSILGGILLAVIFTNMLRVLFNRYAPDCLSAFKSQKAKQIVHDLICVKKIMAIEIEMQVPVTDGVFQTESAMIAANVIKKVNYSGIEEQAPQSARDD